MKITWLTWLKGMSFGSMVNAGWQMFQHIGDAIYVEKTWDTMTIPQVTSYICDYYFFPILLFSTLAFVLCLSYPFLQKRYISWRDISEDRKATKIATKIKELNDKDLNI